MVLARGIRKIHCPSAAHTHKEFERIHSWLILVNWGFKAAFRERDWIILSDGYIVHLWNLQAADVTLLTSETSSYLQHLSFPVQSTCIGSSLNRNLSSFYDSWAHPPYPEIQCIKTHTTMASLHLSFFVLPGSFWCIHPLQSYGWGNPPARGWRSVVLSASTCFPRGKAYVQGQYIRK